MKITLKFIQIQFQRSPNLLYHSLCFTLYSTNKNLTHVHLFNQMLIFCLFIFQTFSFLKVQNKNPTLTTATITGPPPILPAPLKRDHQHCHRPSTNATRSTPPSASQLPKKEKMKKHQHIFTGHHQQTIHQKFTRHSTPNWYKLVRNLLYVL